jgi:predicted  nucleic acid-binding Zn-ribbon protein
MAVETSLALQQLHHLLQQLEDAETLLAHGPKRIAAAKKKIAAAEQVCEMQKEKIQSLRKASDQKNLSLKSNEAEILKLTGRLNQATSNKEYDIIQGQVGAQQSRNESLEDEILTLLTEVDAATAELASAEKAVRELVQLSRDIEAEVQERQPGIRADITRLTAEITEAESAFPPGKTRGDYERLRASMGAGALSEIQDAFCLACNTKLIAQDCVRIKIGEIVGCRECGRMLYTLE